MKKIYLTAILFCFIIFEAYSHESGTRTEVITSGVSLGAIVAGITSWERNRSVLLLVIHSIFSWLYVIYFLITRKDNERK